MVSEKVIVSNPTGLHLRPAGILCELAMQYKCKVTFKTENHYEANAKSVLGVLGAGVNSGEELEICCDGPDESEALAALVTAVSNGLGE